MLGMVGWRMLRRGLCGGSYVVVVEVVVVVEGGVEA